MLPFSAILQRSLALLLATGLLIGCNKDDPTAPSPTGPTATGPTQYATPFAEVPNREDAVIYQVNFGPFSDGGDIAGVTARLDSIKALGANVVYLMPTYPVGALATGVHRSFGSPYCVRDYEAVNASLGTLADLRALVDAAHRKHLSVMLDWVGNHTAFDHPWTVAHPDWYQQDAAGNIVIPPGTNYNDVAQLNYNNAALRAAMIAAIKSWVYRANVDGFRFDYANGVPVSFWRQAVDSLRAIRSHKLLLLAEGDNSGLFPAGFDYLYGFGFYDGLKAVYQRNGAASTIYTTNTRSHAEATGTQRVLHYTTNHDVNSSDGTPYTVFGQDAGAMSAFVIAACSQGMPMIYNGQEAGMQASIPAPAPKITWDTKPAVTRAYKQLLRVRAASAALHIGNSADYSTANVYATNRTLGAEQVLVLANVRNAATQYAVPADFASTSWTDALQGGTVTLNGTVALPAYGYRVLKR